MSTPRASEASDEALLRSFAAGERSALGELARRHERQLLGLARGLLNGSEDAACDAVQEAWVRVIRHAGSFKGKSSFKTWVYRIVINQCHNLRGRKKPLALADGVLEGAAAEVERADAGGEERARLRCEVAKLPEERRLVLLLCYHEGMTHEQAAEVLEIPVGTLKSRLHAALTELRKRLPSEVGT